MSTSGKLGDVPASGRDGVESPFGCTWGSVAVWVLSLFPWRLHLQSKAVALCAHTGAPPPLKQDSLAVVPMRSPRP